tara:strand:+ start:987 stop:1526 length:540 start_codon:yes stop_codon:yes gene_type:complete
MASKKRASEEKIKAMLRSIFAAFPRADGLNDAALGIWSYALRDYPEDKIRKATARWIREEKWPPDSINKFVAAVNKRDGSLPEQEMPGYREFLENYEYRVNQDITDKLIEKEKENEAMGESMRTPFHEAKVHLQLIADILDRKVRPPRSIEKNDIMAFGDAQEKWYWAEFQKRKRSAGS